MAEESEEPQDTGQTQDSPEGEDHREDPPGYDLDEQAAIERLKREQGEQA